MSDKPRRLTVPMMQAAAALAAKPLPFEPGEKCERCGQETMVADFNREMLMCANPFCGEARP